MLVSTLIAFSAPPGCPFVSHLQEGVNCETYSKLNGHGEKVTASLLGDSLAAWNAWQVHKAGFYEAFLAFNGPDDLLRKAVRD